MTPAEWRARFRAGEVRQTAALCHGYAQANMAFIPEVWADDFESFLRANPAACPLLARGRPGDPTLPGLGEFDLRRDLPLYRLFVDGAATERLPDIAGHWRDDLVPFAIGCSLTFEADLVAAGVALRCHAPGVSCSAFDTTIPNAAAGPFGGTLVVTMRAMPEAQVPLAVAVTEAHPQAHGAPVHTGDPSAIGVDLSRPIDGLGLTDVLPGEIPVFWACGVTMERAIAAARLPFAITHAPGHMLITDRPAGGPR
ncbi:DUF1445 domain-containing protein [Rhodobacter sp. SGA-6-6]|uniref:D-glutamate cyclase family protein n=1 Tax=Rhodobacter sp. SGA-6-6 TaxID=2710882 RepID=UPI0013ECF232|nr:DUF1445 domain-containing protein [Rhodobacter sp. SGA-6-6]NGM45882.1 DUF1445 domain-containing protein [Rhodobacter sp. SGA-6-6]